MSNEYFGGGKSENKPVTVYPSKQPPTLPEKPASRVKQASNSALGWVVGHTSLLMIIILFLCGGAVLIISDFDVEGAFWRSALSVSTVLLAACSYLLYLNGYTAGGSTAQRSEFVVKTDEQYRKNITDIRAKKIEWMLELFCNDYKMQELKRARTEIMLTAGLTEEQIAEVLSGKKLPEEGLLEEQKNAIAEAMALKPVKLNKAMITSPLGRATRRDPIRSQKQIELYKYANFALKFVTVILSCAFVVNLSIDIITNFSAEVLVRAIIQVILLLVSVFGGMSLGYKVKLMYTERVQDIIGILFEFWEWYEHRKTQPETSDKRL